MAKQGKIPELDAVKNLVGGTMIWVVAALFLIVVVVVGTLRFGRISGEEVGVKLNKLNGKLEVINSPGTHIYNGITYDFFVLDKTLQTLEMSSSVKKQRGRHGDSIKVKTIDGSDVFVNIKVQYKINPEDADVVIKSSGPGNLFKEKWARDYIRTSCRNYLGELTTEEFYDASKRQKKITVALNETRNQLKVYGIRVDSIVIPSKPTFYREYAEKIKQKKLADQEVQEERSKALAALQRQETLKVMETNKKNVAVKQFGGKMEQLIIKATASAERVKKEADAYFDRVTIGAEATLYKSEKAAAGILAKKEAEAKGILALKEALSGEGGRNMVKLEYARRLRQVRISGKPFTLDGRTARFEHLLPGGIGWLGK